jgi:hypothetical protein
MNHQDTPFILVIVCEVGLFFLFFYILDREISRWK